MSTIWAPPTLAAAMAAQVAPWPPPDPATLVVDTRAVCPWPAPMLSPAVLTAPIEPAAAGRRSLLRPVAIALGTAMVAIAAFGALFLAI